MAEAEKRLGAAERDFIHTASINFLTPLRNFLEGDWKTISVRGLGPPRFLVTAVLRDRLSSHPGSPALPGLPRCGSCGRNDTVGDLSLSGPRFPRLALMAPRASPAAGQALTLPCSPSPQKERRLLQNRRLDLDACKARLKKAKAAEAKATVGVPAGLLPHHPQLCSEPREGEGT